MALFLNTTVSSTRNGTPVYAARQCQVDTVPLRKAPAIPGADALTEIGGLNVATLYDTSQAPGGDWQPGDQVTVLSAVGVSPWRVGTRFGVFTLSPMGGGLPHVTATLIAIPTFTQEVTVSRGTFNSGTGKTAAPASAATFGAYLTDVSTDFRTPGVAPQFLLQLVTDGTSDVQQGDRVTVPAGTLATGNRTPTLIVQHVAVHHLAGWAYKVALVTVQQ
jgi:hypothetical protein